MKNYYFAKKQTDSLGKLKSEPCGLSIQQIESFDIVADAIINKLVNKDFVSVLSNMLGIMFAEATSATEKLIKENAEYLKSIGVNTYQLGQALFETAMEEDLACVGSDSENMYYFETNIGSI